MYLKLSLEIGKKNKLRIKRIKLIRTSDTKLN